MTEFNLVATTRKLYGTNNSKRLRRLQGMIPAIIYGGSSVAETISLEEKELKKAMQHESFYSHILSLTVDQKPQKVILREVQRSPVKSKLIHLDFQRIELNSIITMQIPLHFINEAISPAIKMGGTITKHTIQVELKFKAKDLPEYVEVDLSALKLGQTIHLKDLPLPGDATLAMTGKYLEQSVVSASIPKEEKEEVTETPVAAAKTTEVAKDKRS